MRVFLQLLILAIAMMAEAPVAAELQRIVVSVPGPRNLSYLPVDLIAKIGADRDAGATIKLLHTGGGSVALSHLVTRNVDFAVAGLPAAMSLRANGGDVVCVASVDDKPMFVLMVRGDLRRQVRRIADLKGRVLGVNTSTRSSKTTSQQLLEILLQSDGVTLDSVRIIPAGQSWEEQSSILLTGAADAVMGDEPYASRLQAEGSVFFLASLGDAAVANGLPGGGFLHAAVQTRSDVVALEPGKIQKMVQMLRTTLKWIATHTPEQLVDALGVKDAQERSALVRSLKKYPRAYSVDGSFSTEQLQQSERFFNAGRQGDGRAENLAIESMVDDRWAGRHR